DSIVVKSNICTYCGVAVVLTLMRLHDADQPPRMPLTSAGAFVKSTLLVGLPVGGVIPKSISVNSKVAPLARVPKLVKVKVFPVVGPDLKVLIAFDPLKSDRAPTVSEAAIWLFWLPNAPKVNRPPMRLMAVLS